jgi:hypothetical protein
MVASGIVRRGQRRCVEAEGEGPVQGPGQVPGGSDLRTTDPGVDWVGGEPAGQDQRLQAPRPADGNRERYDCAEAVADKDELVETLDLTFDESA